MVIENSKPKHKMQQEATPAGKYCVSDTSVAADKIIVLAGVMPFCHPVISVRRSRRTRYVVRARALRRFTRTITISVKVLRRTISRIQSYVRNAFHRPGISILRQTTILRI